MNQIQADDNAIDYTRPDWYVGHSGGSDDYVGNLSELWFNNSYIDLSVVGNRRKWINSIGKPVDLLSDGSGPTGTQPLICFNKDTTATWHQNSGSGGGFTVSTGSLSDSTTGSPSD